MGNYVTTAELRTQLSIDDAVEDTTLATAIDAAEREIDGWCGRTFVVPTSATTRQFWCDNPYVLRLPVGNDIANTTGLVVAMDTNDDGTADSTWSSSYYQLWPIGGIGDDGSSGWPYTEIRAVGSAAFVLSLTRPSVHITARWGWAAVPAPVKSATLLLAAETWKSKDAVLGLSTFGPDGARILVNPRVEQLLAPFRRGAAVAGFA